MQYSRLNRAMLRVADTTGTCGRLAAESVKGGRCAKKQSDLQRICVSAIFGAIVSLATVPAQADPGGVPAEIAALQAQVAALQDQVKTLQSQLATVQSNHALLLGPFVSVDPNPEIGVMGPNIIFSGANIHIVSGSGATNDNGNATGLGNLIIGYDEDPAVSPIINVPLKPGDRGGSHNLVIGGFNRFTRAAFGGLVAGENNSISNEGTVVIAGEINTASGPFASVGGGESNTASGFLASVTGGLENVASGAFCSVSGGQSNIANGFVGASVVGGEANIASGILATVSGGFRNTANGYHTVVLGSQNISDNKDLSIAPNPPFP